MDNSSSILEPIIEKEYDNTMIYNEEEQQYNQSKFIKCDETKTENEFIINNNVLSNVNIPESINESKISIWTRHVYLFWLLSCLIIISHTYIIGVFQDDPLFAGAMVVIYIIAISITSFFRSVDIIKITCYEYQFIFWTLWIMYSFVCRGIPDYFHYGTIIASNIITSICVIISLLPDSYSEPNRKYVHYLLLVYLITLLIPHVDANILHASPIISTLRTLLYCIMFIWIRYNNLLNIDRGEFYNLYYYKEIPTIIELLNSRRASHDINKKIVIREQVYIPPWAIGIITTWILLCDPIMIIFSPIQFYIIYLIGRYGNKDNHKYIIQKNEYIASAWPFNIIRDQSVHMSSRIITTSDTLDELDRNNKKNQSSITKNLIKGLNETISLYCLTQQCTQPFTYIIDCIEYKKYPTYSEKVIIDELVRLKLLDIIKTNNVHQKDIENHNRACSYIYGLHYYFVKILATQNKK